MCAVPNMEMMFWGFLFIIAMMIATTEKSPEHRAAIMVSGVMAYGATSGIWEFVLTLP